MGFRVGVDIGGTFTDFCAFDETSGALHTLKVLSTPAEPGSEVLTGIEEGQPLEHDGLLLRPARPARPRPGPGLRSRGLGGDRRVRPNAASHEPQRGRQRRAEKAAPRGRPNVRPLAGARNRRRRRRRRSRSALFARALAHSSAHARDRSTARRQPTSLGRTQVAPPSGIKPILANA